MALITIGGEDINLSLTPLQNFKFWKSGSVGTATPIADLLNAILKYVFPAAGIIMFFLIIASGFALLTSTGNPEKIKAATKRLTMAVVGFIIIFTSYWLIQMLDAILGIRYFT